MWEFQSLITDLTGLPIANVSVYDASTAMTEAITCAVRVHNRKATQKNVVYISELIPPTRRSVIENYTSGGGIELRVLPHLETGHLDLSAIDACEGSCAVYVEQPNPLGLLDEGLLGLKDRIGTGTALIVGVQPTSLGVLEPPGHWGADIVVGEGQPFGSPVTGEVRSTGSSLVHNPTSDRCPDASWVGPLTSTARKPTVSRSPLEKRRYPTSSSDLEHLHERDPDRAHGCHAHGPARAGGR